MANAETKAYKQAMKAYKKGKRKATSPYKGLPVATGVASVVLCAATVATTVFDQTFYILTGSKYSEVQKSAESEGVNADYFTSDFTSEEERLAYGQDVCERVEGEGAVLLKNDNNTLPLVSGSKVSCFSHSSVDLVYGGTGSGSTDSSKAVNLKDALTSVGFEVNESLWNFYTEGAGKDYTRATRSMRGGGTHMINEVPWPEYDEATLSSVANYGDAAVVVFSRVGGEGTDLPTVDGTDRYHCSCKDFKW